MAKRKTVVSKEHPKRAQINFRIDEELLNTLEQWARSTGRDKTRVIVTALHAYMTMKPEEQMRAIASFNKAEDERFAELRRIIEDANRPLR